MRISLTRMQLHDDSHADLLLVETLFLSVGKVTVRCSQKCPLIFTFFRLLPAWRSIFHLSGNWIRDEALLGFASFTLAQEVTAPECASIFATTGRQSFSRAKSSRDGRIYVLVSVPVPTISNHPKPVC